MVKRRIFMDEEILKKYLKAGKIAAKVRDSVKRFMKPGVKLVEIADWVESEIRKEAEIAFPVNISINNIAAHFTPDLNDAKMLKERDMVKIDIGVHVDGYIADTAKTFFVGNPSETEREMMKVNKKVLKEAIKIVKPGLPVNRIGELIESIVKETEFKVIRNLTGHGLDRFNLHAEPQILNIRNESSYVLKEDDVIAIEPFVTNGSGLVNESDTELIFSVFSPVVTRNQDARKIIEFGLKRNGLPFAKRWILRIFNMSEVRFRLALRDLKMKNGIYTYPVLKDIEGCKISQFEHTIIVREKPIVTTLAE